MINNLNIRVGVLFSLIALPLLFSCNKYLEKKQNASQVVPSNLSDLQALLDNGTQTNRISPAYGESSADEYFLSDEVYNSKPEIDQQIYTWRKFSVRDGSASGWQTSYTAVYYDNLVLDLLKNIPDIGSNNLQKNVKGSALFYRAYHFLNLLWEYAKAYDDKSADKNFGIALRLTSNFNVPSTRASLRESYQQVIRDAKASILLLPRYPFVQTRPSIGAAYGLLARCYLSMSDYENALKYADSALQLNSNLIDFNGDPDMIRDIAADAPFKQYNKETVFYCEMSYTRDVYSYVSNIDTTIISLYQPGDLRKTAYIGNSATNTYFKGSYCGNKVPNFTGIATDEMYLIRAECYIRTDQVPNGLADINTLLIKRYKTGYYTPIVELSQKDALESVLEERRKELLFRGNRWSDIKRLNIEGANIAQKRIVNGTTYILEPNSDFYALPLPADIVRMTGMPQN